MTVHGHAQPRPQMELDKIEAQRDLELLFAVVANSEDKEQLAIHVWVDSLMGHCRALNRTRTTALAEVEGSG